MPTRRPTSRQSCISGRHSAISPGSASFASPSRLVVLDIDIRDDQEGTYSGWDTLENMGVHVPPETPMAHSPRDRGSHIYFHWPEGVAYVKGAVGTHGLGKGLDIRATGNFVTAPPLGKVWDPHWNFETVEPVPMPSWMRLPEREPVPAQSASAAPRPAFKVELNQYAAAALDSAVRKNRRGGQWRPALDADRPRLRHRPTHRGRRATEQRDRSSLLASPPDPRFRCREAVATRRGRRGRARRCRFPSRCVPILTIDAGVEERLTRLVLGRDNWRLSSVRTAA
jgi:hypothetical protein